MPKKVPIIAPGNPAIAPTICQNIANLPILVFSNSNITFKRTSCDFDTI